MGQATGLWIFKALGFPECGEVITGNPTSTQQQLLALPGLGWEKHSSTLCRMGSREQEQLKKDP